MNKAHSFFVTGISTDIGKTYIASLLVKGFEYAGLVSYMKPVQTGCSPVSKEHRSAPDYDYVKEKAHPVFPCSFSDHVPYCFEPACSPHLAASLANTVIDLHVIEASFRKISSHVDTLIVEGAGGVLVPLGETVSTLDLIKHLVIPVIVVTTPGLGALNHTFLTINELRNAAVPVAGIVMNNNANIANDYIYNDNRRMIAQYAAPVPLIEVSHGADCDEQFVSFCKRIRTV